MQKLTDAEIISELGGPSEVCKLLGWDASKGGAQRVQNWISRGIPPKVKLDHPEIFLKEFVRQPKAA